jgi:hypothetical protein
MKNEFSTLDIVKALDIPRERLREWMNRSYIVPTTPTQGQGKKSVFTRQDVYGVQLFRQLVDFGMERDQARHFVKFYHDRMKTDNEQLSYMIIRYGKLKPQIKFGSKVQYSASFANDGNKLNLDEGTTDDHKEINDEYWRTIHVVNLKTLHKETDSALQAL